MKTLIFGAGYLGRRLATALPDAAISHVDIADAMAVRDALAVGKPDSVLNAAGKTGNPNVDWCEQHKGVTARSNVIGALVLAEACAKAGVHLTHIGSGCIFYGASPDPQGWRETDHANPSAFYSRTKYAAEVVLSDLPNVAVVRIRMPIGGIPDRRNLITKLSAYPKIIDVENSVTVIDDLVSALSVVMDKRASGVFHAVNDGTMKHRDLIALYEELVDPEHSNEWISSEEMVALGLTAKARSNCVLQNTRLRELGATMRPIAVALRDCMEQYARARRLRHDPVM